MERFGLSEAQATAIVQMQLGRLSGLERQKIEDELSALRIRIKELLEILGDEHLVMEILKKEIAVIRDKYGDCLLYTSRCV